jgi:putative endonuclease
MANARRSSLGRSNARAEAPHRARIPALRHVHAKADRMYYVYILRSCANPDQTYVGSTSDLKKRIAERNSRKSIHTNKLKPWKLEAYVAFPHKKLADEFEKYLKSGSGRAFANRHLWASPR